MGEFVTVLSKSPLGIVLNLDVSEWLNKSSPGMVPVTRIAAGKLPPVTLKGTAYRQGFDPPPLNIGGYVPTRVPKAFWDQWLKTHGDFGPLIDGYIKVAATADEAEGIAAEMVNDRGMNPRLLQDGDPRVRAISPGITTADEQKTKFAA